MLDHISHSYHRWLRRLSHPPSSLHISNFSHHLFLSNHDHSQIILYPLLDFFVLRNLVRVDTGAGLRMKEQGQHGVSQYKKAGSGVWQGKYCTQATGETYVRPVERLMPARKADTVVVTIQPGHAAYTNLSQNP